MLLCQACPFAHLLSFMSFWSHTHIPIQNQVIAIHVRIAMFMLLWTAGPFAHLLSFMFHWSHTHTYTKSGDSNTCENSYVHAALPSMPVCTSTLLHVFLVTHTYLYKVRRQSQYMWDVAVSIGEAAKPRVFCYVDVAVSIGEAAAPRVFCCVDVAVSIGEAACAPSSRTPPTFAPKRPSMRICKPTVLFVFFH